MANAPNAIVNQVKPYTSCPDPLWEGIVQYESNFNPVAVGDNGSSFGLFQLHIGGQADAALAYIQQTTGNSGWAAVTYLQQHTDIQAKFGMPAINNAWNQLKDTYNPSDRDWWLKFCSISGHPGGNPTDPTTNAYVNDFMTKIVIPNQFGIQQINSNTQSGQTAIAEDNTWLQALTTMSPHQPCSVIWRRSCPNAKNAMEGGMDLPSPAGTAVHSLGDGNVIGAGYFWHPAGNPGYGVVTVRTKMPDGSVADVYYQHIQIAQNIVLCNQYGGQIYGGVVGPKPTFQTIQKGQLLGTNIVGEVEVGVNADWSGVWGDSPHPGPWLDDPEDTIRSLMSYGGGTPGTQLLTGTDPLSMSIQSTLYSVHNGLHTLTQVQGLAGPIEIFNDAQKFVPFSVPPDSNSNVPVIGGISSGLSYPTRLAIGIMSFVMNNAAAFLIRAFFVLFALVIIIALIINLTSKVTETTDDGRDLPTEGGGVNPLQVAELAAV